MQHQYNNFYEYFYKDSNGSRRKNGIFAPGLDRFILIDNNDFWITLQTAEILSSKLPTLVYILSDTPDIDNNNCMDYTIFNKTQQKIGPSSIVVGRQQPMLKMLYDEDKVTYAGVPEDYKQPDRQAMLTDLKTYAIYAHKRLYAINLTDSFYNFTNTRNFIESYTDPAWTENINAKSDRSKTDKGIFFKLKHVLYMANDVLDAENQIIELWKNNTSDQLNLMTGYYKMLRMPVPKQLQHRLNSKPDSISTFLF